MIKAPDGELRPSEVSDRDIKLLLDEISREPVPEKMLKLAQELQCALQRKQAAYSDDSGE